MIVHNTAVARRRVLFLVNRARFTTVLGQGQALAPPPYCLLVFFITIILFRMRSSCARTQFGQPASPGPTAATLT